MHGEFRMAAQNVTKKARQKHKHHRKNMCMA
jgi:hypothetical protein